MNKGYVLLLEGYTDKKLLEHLLPNTVNCQPKCDTGSILNGKDGILLALPEQLDRLLESKIDKLAIAIDADADFDARKQQIEAILHEKGFDIVSPISLGLGVKYCHQQNSNFQVGVLIFPNHQDTGELETLLSACADQTKLTAYSEFIDAQRLAKQEKSTIFCWLASNTHTCGFDNLFINNLIDINHPSIQGIKTWLEEVYK
jgi:hypothetical protein